MTRIKSNMPLGAFGTPSFSGGVRFNATSPPEVGRPAISGFTGGEVQPVSGVQPKAANFARNNRGSNVTIPHARVVPASHPDSDQPEGAYMPPGAPPGHSGPRNGPTSALRAGQLAFVFAQRSSDDGQARVKTNRTGNGVDRVDTLCSLPYLQAEFSRIHSTRRVLDTTSITTDDYTNRSHVWKNGILQTAHQLDFSRPGVPVAHGVAAVPAIESAFNTGGEQVVAMTDHLHPPGKLEDKLNVGLFTRDVHPFIRGKSFASTTANMPTDKGPGTGKEVPRSIADQVAIALFQKQLAAAGLFDWQPDGVVLSKDHSSSDDVFTEREFDARLHELYNVAVQGPATTSMLTGDSRLLTLPGDMVFVLMICDVVYRPDLGVNGSPSSAGNPAVDTLSAEEYGAWRDLQRNTRAPGDVVYESASALMGFADQSKEVMRNFRLKVSTSSDMVHNSGVDCFGTQSSAAWNCKPTERMGLKFTDAYAEYVVGGWLIGRVLDSSTARTRVPGAHLINSDPTSYAVSVDVNVEWWSGDRLCRNFCDHENSTMKTRHSPSSAPGAEKGLHFMNRTAEENLEDPEVATPAGGSTKLEGLFGRAYYHQILTAKTVGREVAVTFMKYVREAPHFLTWWDNDSIDRQRRDIIHWMFHNELHPPAAPPGVGGAVAPTIFWGAILDQMKIRVIELIEADFNRYQYLLKSTLEGGASVANYLTVKDKADALKAALAAAVTAAATEGNTLGQDTLDSMDDAFILTKADDLVADRGALENGEIDVIATALAVAVTAGTRAIPTAALYTDLRDRLTAFDPKFQQLGINIADAISKIDVDAMATPLLKTAAQELQNAVVEIFSSTDYAYELCDTTILPKHAVFEWQASDPIPKNVPPPNATQLAPIVAYFTP